MAWDELNVDFRAFLEALGYNNSRYDDQLSPTEREHLSSSFMALRSVQSSTWDELSADFRAFLESLGYNKSRYEYQRERLCTSFMANRSVQSQQTGPSTKTTSSDNNTGNNELQQHEEFGPFLLLQYINPTSHDDGDGEKTRLAVELPSVRTYPELKEMVANVIGSSSGFSLFVHGRDDQRGENTIRRFNDFSGDGLKGSTSSPILLQYAPSGSGSRTPPPAPPQKYEVRSVSEPQYSFFFPPTFEFGIPDFYEHDDAYAMLSSFVDSQIGGDGDNPTAVIMSVPGAGKSRTVFEVGDRIKCLYHREKFGPAHPFILACWRIANQNRGNPPPTYKKRKQLFYERCIKFFKEILETRAKGKGNGKFLLHFDEVQLIMGNRVVSAEDDHGSSHSPNLFHYVMPAFGDIINKFTNKDLQLRVALTGTNFFASLAFTSGTHLKRKILNLEGGFPYEWAKELLYKYFKFKAPEAEVEKCIKSMCANRRAVQFLAYQFEISVGVYGNVSLDVLQQSAEKAYVAWSRPIAEEVGGSRTSALSLLALLTYPYAWDATEENGKLFISKDQIPETVKTYALAGGVKMEYGTGRKSYEIYVPTGCSMRLLVELCSKATHGNNMDQFEAFRVVSKTVECDKGHFFERMIACELTFVSSELYKILLPKNSIDIDRDPKMLGRDFDYAADIHNSTWMESKVFCVMEENSKKGNHVVDVGFPALKDKTTSCRVYCELKVVQDVSKLWKMCAEFFDKMISLGIGAADKNTIATFLSFHPFKDNKPNPAQVRRDGNVSAFDSRSKVEKVLAENPTQLLIVDGNDLKPTRTVLPIVDLYTLIDAKESSKQGVTKISNEATKIYFSSSRQSHPSPGDCQQSKKSRIK